MSFPFGSGEFGNRRILIRNRYIQGLRKILTVTDPNAVVLCPTAVKRQILGDAVFVKIPCPFGLAAVRRFFLYIIFFYMVAAADRSFGIGSARSGRKHERVSLGIIQLLFVSAGSTAAKIDRHLVNIPVLLQLIQLFLLPV